MASRAAPRRRGGDPRHRSPPRGDPRADRHGAEALRGDAARGEPGPLGARGDAPGSTASTSSTSPRSCATSAARSARPTRSAAPSRAVTPGITGLRREQGVDAPGHPGGGARPGPQRHRQGGPAGAKGWSLRGRLGAGPLPRPARPRPLTRRATPDGLRSLHPVYPPRRGRARRALVVGGGFDQGVRPPRRRLVRPRRRLRPGAGLSSGRG